MSDPKLLNRITARPDVFGGKPIIRDMRVSVELSSRLHRLRTHRRRLTSRLFLSTNRLHHGTIARLPVGSGTSSK